MKKSNLTPVVYAALYLTKKKPGEKVSYGSGLISSITGNASLPTPDPSLTEYETIVTNLSDADAAFIATGSNLDKQNLSIAESAFDIQTRRLADYVQSMANQNAPKIAKAIILSAGMLTRKTPEPTPVPDAVTALSAIYTNTPGTILAKWKGVKFARTYVVYYSTSEGISAVWTQAGITTPKKWIVTGLTSGTRYYIKVVAVGVHGNSPDSVIATCIAS